MRQNVFVTTVLSVIVLAAVCASCGNGGTKTSGAPGRLPDTLRVATLYSPTSYFIYRGEPMGYDYTLVDSLARQKGMVLDLKVAKSLAAAVAMLDSGAVDLIACQVPITNHYRQYVLPCGPENMTSQVLVQPKVRGEAPLTDVTDLVGKEVFVEKDSKYLRRVQHLNDEIGGGIIIREVDADSIIPEDLIAMVSDGKIPLTVVDSDIAMLNRTYYPDLDVSVQLSFPQRARQLVLGLGRKGKPHEFVVDVGYVADFFGLYGIEPRLGAVAGRHYQRVGSHEGGADRFGVGNIGFEQCVAAHHAD